MQVNKTQPAGSPDAFIAAIADDRKRVDAETLVKLMSEVTGEPAELWYPSMIGFGKWRYRYESGREGDWFFAGFSPRKTNLTVYLPGGFDALQSQLDRLGKHSHSKVCLYFKRLSDIDLDVLREMVTISSDWARSSPQRIDRPADS